MSTNPDEMPLAAAKALPPPGPWTRLGVHARVVVIGVTFGLVAYAVIQALIAVTRHLGWLEWLHR